MPPSPCFTAPLGLTRPARPAPTPSSRPPALRAAAGPHPTPAKRLKRLLKARARLVQEFGALPTAPALDARVVALEAHVASASSPAPAPAAPPATAPPNPRAASTIEVCTGNACARANGAAVLARARARAAGTDATVVRAKCLKACGQPGATVRLAGRRTLSVVDPAVVDDIFAAAAAAAAER